eukprot:254859_1
MLKGVADWTGSLTKEEEKQLAALDADLSKLVAALGEKHAALLTLDGTISSLSTKIADGWRPQIEDLSSKLRDIEVAESGGAVKSEKEAARARWAGVVSRLDSIVAEQETAHAKALVDVTAAE